jgi:ketosteroid isomerase-like protein
MLCCCAGLLLPFPALAQDAGKGSAPDEAIHQELRKLRDDMVDAFNKKDVERLLRYVTDDAVLTWQNAEVSRGHQGLRQYYEKMMTGPDRRVLNVSASAPQVDELTRLYGPQKDSGMAFGSLDQDFELTDGMKLHLANRWTAHLVKDGGQWKVSALHISADLFNNPVLGFAMRRTAIWSALAGLAAGLLIGLLIGVIAWRRRRVTP